MNFLLVLQTVFIGQIQTWFLFLKQFNLDKLWKLIYSLQTSFTGQITWALYKLLQVKAMYDFDKNHWKTSIFPTGFSWTISVTIVNFLQDNLQYLKLEKPF